MDQKFRKVFKKPGYYFHPDEDFKEDWDWGKEKTDALKTISKLNSQLKI